MKKDVIIGIDGGGSFTRAIVADLQGNILGFTKTDGVHPQKNHQPVKNIQKAVFTALEKSAASLDSVKYIVGGIAGLNDPSDKKWVEDHFVFKNIHAPIHWINDAEVAQYGAFLGKPGIIAIAGTGSIVFGKLDNDQSIRNYDFQHKSRTSARYLSTSLIYQIISEDFSEADSELIQQVLNYWKVNNISALRSLAAEGFSNHQIEGIKLLSKMAPMITEAAADGNKLAYKSCETATETLMTGIKLVASMYRRQPINLGLIGGVATSPIFQELIEDKLTLAKQDIHLKKPILPPVMGALLIALEKLGINQEPQIIDNLKNSSQEFDYQ